MNTRARLLCTSAAAWFLTGCATEDLFVKQPMRLAYEVSEKVALARPQFNAHWHWYRTAIDPRAPTAEIEVCLTISPEGQVIDAYIDASTIRRPEFVRGVLDIYERMKFSARNVEELTLCDDPLVFNGEDEARHPPEASNSGPLDEYPNEPAPEPPPRDGAAQATDTTPAAEIIP